MKSFMLPQKLTNITIGKDRFGVILQIPCKEHHIEGRLIPVPKEITAGCGMAWMTPLENEKSVVQFMKEQGCSYD